MAGQPKRRAREAAEAAAAGAARVGETFPPPVRPGVVAATIAQTLPLVPATPVSAASVLFPAASAFPGVSGPRVVKRPPITAFDPPPVVAPAIPVAPPPPPPRTAPDPSEFAAPPPPPPPRARPAPAPVAPPPAVFPAAHANEYAQRMSAREAEHWAKTREVPVAEPTLMHAWAWAVQQYPASAMTIWLTRSVPEQGSYQFFVTGEELAGDYYPDRKIYETVRLRRRQPTIAEKFIGRIRGVSAEGKTLDIAFGEISFPPEERSAPQPWGPAQPPGVPWGSPWAGGLGAAPPPWGPPPPGYGPPPGWGYPPPWGPPSWGGPPPPWAVPAAATAQPPAHVAADPAMLEIWKMVQETQIAAAKASAETSGRATDAQSQLIAKLLERAFAPPPAAKESGGFRETVGMLSEVANLFDKVKGSGGDSGGGRSGIHIHRVDDDLIVENKDGEIDPIATIGLGVKGGFKELVRTMAASRGARAAAAPNGAPSGGAPSLGAGLAGGPSVKKSPPPNGASG